MNDPRTSIEKCIDAADELIVALVELKKIFFAILDAADNQSKKDK